MSQPNTRKKKVPNPSSIKRHQPKKECSLRSKHNIKTATISEISHSGERVQQTINEERLLSDQNKSPSVFAKPGDPNLTANYRCDYRADNQYGRNGYDHTDIQYGRYGYNHQAANQYDGNGCDHTDNQYGRYGYDHQADNQYDGSRYDHTDSQYSRYGHDHQDNNKYVNGYDYADYQYSGNERNDRADDQYGGHSSDQADNEGYGVSRCIRSNERHHFYGNDSYISSKYFWGNHQNNTDTQHPKQNQITGRGWCECL